VTNEQLPAHIVKASLHKSKPWASYWLDRYNNNNNIYTKSHKFADII